MADGHREDMSEESGDTKLGRVFAKCQVSNGEILNGSERQATICGQKVIGFGASAARVPPTDLHLYFPAEGKCRSNTH